MWRHVWRPALSVFSEKELARLTGADCFVLALGRMMSRHGQHGLIGQTHVRMDSVPDIARMEESARSLAAAHPLLNAVARRSPFTLRVAWRGDPSAERHLPVNLWFEKGASVPAGRRATEIESEAAWVDDTLNQPFGFRDGLRNLHIDLMLLRSGGSLLVLTWTHLLFDGKGAEFLVDALVNPPPSRAANVPLIPPAAPPRDTLRNRIRMATPVVERLFVLAGDRYESLAGPKPRHGRLRFRMRTFDAESTARIQAGMEAAVGPLFSIGFFLASALRAHREAFLARGRDPAHYVVSIPVQIRKKGFAAVPFQNCVTILFFALAREALVSMPLAAKVAQAQFEEMTHGRLDRSFTQVLELMRRLPSAVYLAFVRWQFGGEITAFFHSFTGEFSARLGDVFGARVANAYHIPSVSAPPGSGLFFGLFNGRLNVTFSWREGSVTSEEADLVLARVSEDLLGGDLPDLRAKEFLGCVPT